jgi:hypothetical protein
VNPLANPPDLVHASADVTNGSITLTVTLAPGTFNWQTTVLLIDLDADQNASTGDPRSGLGVDYTSFVGNGRWATSVSDPDGHRLDLKVLPICRRRRSIPTRSSDDRVPCGTCATGC